MGKVVYKDLYVMLLVVMVAIINLLAPELFFKF